MMKQDNDVAIEDESLNYIAKLIEQSKQKVYAYVNSELITLYWNVGKYISENIPKREYGKKLLKKLSELIQRKHAGIQGFSYPNLSRMRQFYETYKDAGIFSTVLRELSWSHNISILMLKTPEEREYYLRTTIKYHYSVRELERQIKRRDFESRIISGEINKNSIVKHKSLEVFRDSYALEFLNIPPSHRENDLRNAILNNLKKFILEFGRDFTFIGQEYLIQVGNSDFKIDLVFYHRVLKCLVAVELKTGKFKPEHLGQLNFYLEALDRLEKKENENPSVGIVLCAKKDDIVVEFAMANNLKPSLVADYQLYLPSKKHLVAQAQLVLSIKKE